MLLRETTRIGSRGAQAHKTVALSMMVAGALILSLIDSRIVLIPLLPGIKIGIANIITLIVIRFWGWKEATAVTLIRCVLAGVFSGNLISMALGLCGGLLSTAVMSFMLRFPNFFSMTGASILGAEAHNVGQLIAASVFIGSPSVFLYAPYLLGLGVVTGLCIGIGSVKVCKSLERTPFLSR